MNTDNMIYKTLMKMIQAECFASNGTEKKQIVIDSLDNKQEIIESAIEFIIYISNNRSVLKLINSASKNNCCF